MLSLDISKMEVGKTYKGTVTFADETEYNGKIAIILKYFHPGESLHMDFHRHR